MFYGFCLKRNECPSLLALAGIVVLRVQYSNETSSTVRVLLPVHQKQINQTNDDKSRQKRRRRGNESKNRLSLAKCTATNGNLFGKRAF